VFSYLAGCEEEDIPIKNVRKVLRSFFVQQFRFGFPIKPTDVEWPVEVADKILSYEPAPHKFFTNRNCLVSCSILENACRNPPHFIVADIWIEIFFQPFDERILFHVYQKIVAASFHTGE